jgi:hypothetical protein
MLANPDIQASAVINRWIQGVQQFDFKLVHVPAYKHKGPDALSRRPHSKSSSSEETDPEEWVDSIALFTQVHSQTKTPTVTPSKFQEPTLQPDDTLFIDFLHPQIRIGALKKQDPEKELSNTLRYLVTGKEPELETSRQQKRFRKTVQQYYIEGTHLYRRLSAQPPQVVIFNKKRRRAILWEMHEKNGHHGVWAVAKQTTLRYYWPSILTDIKHHIQSCHTCQLRSTKKMHLPITMSQPQRLFSKVYLDVMKMPKAQGMQWLVACRDDLSGVTECQALRKDNAKAIANFFYHQIILRYGNVIEVVTDNGPSFHGEFEQLLKDYGVKQIKISPYNSQANGVVERGHFNIREALVKLSKNKIAQWPQMVSAACYTDRITIRRSTGYSPFYLLHGVHPFLPCDLVDATFMVTQFKPGMTDIELIAARTQQLLRLPQDIEKAKQTLQKARIRSKKAFESKYARRMIKSDYEPGTLVLLRNVPLENTMSSKRKTSRRYMGPYQVDRKTQGGSYVLKEMNGNTLRHTVAAFRLIPYIQRKDLQVLVQETESTDEEEEQPESSESSVPENSTNSLTHSSAEPESQSE